MTPLPIHRHHQSGSSLIEVLVAILLLSFGMLSLGAMMAFAVQMPKLSGYRATAVNLASSHIERMRANPGTPGFKNGDYDKRSYDGTFDPITFRDEDYCRYPDCNAKLLAVRDIADTKSAVRRELPAGDILMWRDDSSGGASTLADTVGNLWIVWQEPSTYAALNPSSSDNCPTEITGTYTNPTPRCLYVRFKL